MSKQVIYLKEANSYQDLLKKEYKKVPIFFKKIIFLYKNIFNIVTKKKIYNKEIWILPIKEKYSLNKLEKILKKDLQGQDNIYLVSNELKESKICLLMDEQNIKYITQEKLKKYLIFNILKYILNLQNEEMSNIDLTILVNDTSNIKMYLIEELAKQTKNLKIVSLNIYKFKNIEEKLYNEYGIAIQFSNSYRKSLEKSKLIINLDFNELEINEYEIFDKAIIINCIEENIRIRKKFFNGIIINSCDIEYKKELINQFKEMNIHKNYTKFMCYAGIIEEKSIMEVYRRVEEDKVSVIGLIGNKGVINKNEFTNISKKLDKNKKTE